MDPCPDCISPRSLDRGATKLAVRGHDTPNTFGAVLCKSASEYARPVLHTAKFAHMLWA